MYVYMYVYKRKTYIQYYIKYYFNKISLFIILHIVYIICVECMYARAQCITYLLLGKRDIL